MGNKADAPHDIGRLPVWARRGIERLRANVADLSARLSAGPDDSDTFADPYATPAVPLGKGTMIRFGERAISDCFDVRLLDGGLMVRAIGRTEMLIIPRIANSIRIERR